VGRTGMVIHSAAAYRVCLINRYTGSIAQCLNMSGHACYLGAQNLAKDPEARRWYVQAELVHCRTAMVGAAGILLPAVSSTRGVAGAQQQSTGMGAVMGRNHAAAVPVSGCLCGALKLSRLYM
jgi:hypothetical protein